MTGSGACGKEILALLTASADRVAALLAELGDERERRNELVAQAVDERIPRRAIGRAARVSLKSVSIFAAEYG